MKMEKAQAKVGCTACGPDRIWFVEEVEGVDWYASLRERRFVCERCGQDWTGWGGKVIPEGLWEGV
ncbi:MAG: hypothetical protein VYC34_09465 [Planctomycetota bacterium]|nr:hypothetical protein [Planctomycetota bacterium]